VTRLLYHGYPSLFSCMTVLQSTSALSASDSGHRKIVIRPQAAITAEAAAQPHSPHPRRRLETCTVFGTEIGSGVIPPRRLMWLLHSGEN